MGLDDWLNGEISWEEVCAAASMIDIFTLFLDKKEILKDNDFRKYDVDRCAWEAINKVTFDQLPRVTLNFPGLKTSKVYANSPEGHKILRHKFAYDWYKDLTAIDANAGFYFQTRVLQGKPIDREAALRELIGRNGDTLSFLFLDPLDQADRLDVKGEQRLRFLVNWFIRRYDFSTAGWLIMKLQKNRARTGKSAPADSNLKEPKKNTISPREWLFQAVILLALVGFAFSPFLSIYLYRIILSVSYLAIITSMVMAWLNRDFILITQLFSLRLASCIVIGYLPLILQGDAWEMVPGLAASQTWSLCSGCTIPKGIVLGLMSILAAFGYLFIEVHNSITNRVEAFKRAGAVFLRGLFWSLSIGLILLDLVGDTFVNLKGLTKEITVVPGILGNIPVEVLLIYLPLALFIGLFVQIIWEEKPITEPL